MYSKKIIAFIITWIALTTIGFVFTIVYTLEYSRHVEFHNANCTINSKYFDIRNYADPINYQIYFNVTSNSKSLIAYYQKVVSERKILHYTKRSKAEKIFNNFNINNTYSCFIPEEPYEFSFKVDFPTHVVYLDYNTEDENKTKLVVYWLMVSGWIIFSVGLLPVIFVIIRYTVRWIRSAISDKENILEENLEEL